MGRRRWLVGLLASMAVVAAACGGETVDVDPIGETTSSPDDGTTEAPEPAPEPEPEPDPAPGLDPEPDDAPADPPEPTNSEAPDDDPGMDDGGFGGAGEDPQDDDDVGTAPTAAPDPTRLDDPCAEHPDGEMASFIDLVSPVEGQIVSDEVALVGCANVFEANVEWQVVDEEGAILTDGFTTADCSMTCNGVFDDVVTLEAATAGSTVTLEVFSSNMADEGPDRLEEVRVTLTVE